MRYLPCVCLLSTLAMGTLQAGPPAEREQQEFQEQVEREAMELGRQEARLKLAERRLDLAQKRKMLERREHALHRDEGPGWGKGKKRGWLRPGIARKRWPALVVAKLFVVSSLLCALLHILLTVLVFGDMRERGAVNGLWVPIVLIGGVFAAMVYALFRQRDAGA